MSVMTEGAGRRVVPQGSILARRSEGPRRLQVRRRLERLRTLRPGRRALRLAMTGTLIGFVTTASVAASTPAEATVRSLVAGAPSSVGSFVRIGSAAKLPARAVLLGAVPSSTQLGADVVLAPQDAAELSGLASSVSSPSSRLYRHYLSARSFARLFAPSASEVTLVEAELRASGLTVLSPADHGFLIPVRGTSATISRTFHTRLAEVRLADGTIGRIAMAAPGVPAAIGSLVSSVIGLDNLGRPESFARAAPSHSHATAVPGAASAAGGSAGPRACAQAAAFAPIFGAYTPDQIARAYGLDGLYKRRHLGAGQTVGIFELEPFRLSDVAAFDMCFFGKSHTSSVTVLPVDGGEQPGPGSGEAALDVEEVSALAPAAHIDVYEAPQTFTAWIDEIAAIVSQDRVAVVSTSWGLCEAQLSQDSPGFQQVENVLFQQAALEGQSWFAASGDSGSEGCARNNPADASLSVSDPGSQPYVTAVGGTTILAPTDPPTEVGWNDGGIAGQGSGGSSGGGMSSLWQMPAWQSGLHVAGVQNHYSSGASCAAPAGVECREVPDVSANADEYHGDLVYYGGGWTSFGGTSAAAPKWAAIAVLADAECATEHVGPIGFANPALYQIASNPTRFSEAFNDVTLGNNDVLAAHHGAYPATKGYDLATGLGSPRVTSPSGGPGLASLLCANGTALSPRPLLTGVNPEFGRYQGGTTVTITGTDLTGVTAVNFGSSVVHVTPGEVNGAGTHLTVVTPASPLSPTAPGGPIGGVVVTVGGPSGSSEPSPLAEFHFVDENGSSSPVPSLSYVGPTAGSIHGGQTVILIGSGFDEGLPPAGKPTVRFGGISVPAKDVTARSDAELAVVVPAETGSTHCATSPGVSTTNICQVEVTVSNSNGTSTTTPILPAPTGSTQVAQPPNTELVASATEYDYAPLPTTTSISPKQLPEQENLFVFSLPTVTINGSGFNFLTLAGVTFGPVGSSYATPAFGLAAIGPHQLQVFYIGLDRLAPVTTMPVTVQTAGGSSNPQTVTIATVPLLLSVSAHHGPTTGGTRLTATGIGFSAGDDVEFAQTGPFGAFGLTGTQDVRVLSSHSLTFVTPAAPAGRGIFEVCNTAGCSPLTDTPVSFTYYEPVRPVVETVSPTSGPAGGGGFVMITGTGLGNVQSVYFGRARSPVVANSQTLVGSSDTEVVAVVPPGKAGSRERIRVTTFAGTGSGPNFRYVRSAPAAPGSVAVRALGGSIAVSWKRSASDGGSPLTGYRVSALPKVGLGLNVDVPPSVLHALLTPLTPGVSYKISVSAESALGRSTKGGPSAVPFLGDNGYVIAGRTGDVAGFGSLAGAPSGTAGRSLPAPIVGLAGTPEAQGYWLAGADGSVYAFGNARDLGSLAGAHLRAPIVGIVATPDGGGYWLIGANGRVASFGTARLYGSLADKILKSPVVGMATTPDGRGYWLVTSAGRVSAFGDARRLGSLRAKGASVKIVAVVADPVGMGYWLVSSNGGVFNFGVAGRHGSLRGSLEGRRLRAPIVAGVATPGGGGYWLLAGDGHVYGLGRAQQVGSAQGLLGGRVSGIAL